MGRKKKPINREEHQRALLRTGGLWDKAARYLKISKSTLYRRLNRLGLKTRDYRTPQPSPDSAARLLPAPAPPKALLASPPAAQAEPQLSEAEVCELMRRFDLSREVVLHDCGDDRECPMCRQIALAWHRVYGCPGGDCGLQHKLNPASVGLAPKKPELWCSYNPRKRPWER